MHPPHHARLTRRQILRRRLPSRSRLESHGETSTLNAPTPQVSGRASSKTKEAQPSRASSDYDPCTGLVNDLLAVQHRVHVEEGSRRAEIEIKAPVQEIVAFVSLEEVPTSVAIDVVVAGAAIK
jgi:hypothetical protein